MHGAWRVIMRVRARGFAAPLTVACALALAAGGGATLTAQAPEAWLLAGQNPDDYRLTRDVDVARSGEASMRLAARGNRRGRDWVVSVQMVDATAYRGKRIRIRGYLRSDDVDSGGLWLRSPRSMTWRRSPSGSST